MTTSVSGAASVGAARAATLTPFGLTHPVIRTDPNDTKGPLDLRSLKLIHVPGHTDNLSFSTWGNVSTADLDPSHRGYFEVGLDFKNEPKFRYQIFVFEYRGHLTSTIYNVRRHGVFGRAGVRRLGAKRFAVSIPIRFLGNPTSYSFALFSIQRGSPCSAKHPCIDAIPSRLPLLIEDLQPPSGRWLAGSAYSTDTSATLTAPVSFSVSDNTYGSGVRNWTLQKHRVGGSGWINVETGTGKAPTVPVTGIQGGTYDLRVLVTDREGNTDVVGNRKLAFPFDDQNPALTYTGTWTTSSDVTTSYLGTTSASNTTADTATLTFVGPAQVCAVTMPVADVAYASLSAGNGFPQSLEEWSGSAPHGASGCLSVNGAATATHTVTLYVDNGPDPFVFDGFLLVR